MIQLVRVELGLLYRANSRRHLKPFRGVEAARSAVVADNRFVFAAVATFTFTANNVIVNNKLQRAFNTGSGHTRQWRSSGVDRWALGKVQGAPECSNGVDSVGTGQSPGGP